MRAARTGWRCCSGPKATAYPPGGCDEADEAVRIPMSPAARGAGVDSLNVVAAAAIACHLLAARG